MRMLLLALFVAAGCLAQDPGQPRLVLDTPQFDFGTIAPDVPVSHRFKARNGGNAPLTISQISPACGCTSAVLGDSNLSPGESTDLEVTFNPSGYLGLARKTVQVVSNDPEEPSQTLTFQATVRPAVIVSTQEVLFTDLGPRDHRKAKVRLESGTATSLGLGNVVLSEAPWLGVATREEGKVLWVDLDLAARRLPERKLTGTDTITLQVDNPAPSSVNLKVKWERRAPVSASPERVAWAGPAGQALQASVLLKHRQGKPFRILSARTSTPLIQVAGLDPKPAARQGFRLTLAADAQPGTLEEKVFLTLDTPGHPELEFRVSAALQ